MPIPVCPASPADFTAACRLLTSDRPAPARELAAARLRDLLTTREFDPRGVFVAQDDSGTIRGAVLVQPMPGALGLAWSPRAEPGRFRTSLEDTLLAVGCQWLRGRGVKVCQAFTPAQDHPDAAALERNGFRFVTHVVHLRRTTEPAASSFPGYEPLAFARFDASIEVVFASTLLATYDGSHDCPELTGDRTPEELLDGFRGAIRPGWWFLARHAGEPVGVVLFDAGTVPGSVELSYLGLVPAARGRGWGNRLVRFALGVATGDGARTLTLSVDARNEPALRLYRRHGFVEHDRRAVFLAAW